MHLSRKWIQTPPKHHKYTPWALSCRSIGVPWSTGSSDSRANISDPFYYLIFFKLCVYLICRLDGGFSLVALNLPRFCSGIMDLESNSYWASICYFWNWLYLICVFVLLRREFPGRIFLMGLYLILLKDFSISSKRLGGFVDLLELCLDCLSSGRRVGDSAGLVLLLLIPGLADAPLPPPVPLFPLR